MSIVVTGGAGFIGGNFVLDWLQHCDELVINIDKLTYAGNLSTLKSVLDNPSHKFVQADICEKDLISQLLFEYKPRAIIHFAAESHVDRSINGPKIFLKTNIEGTFSLLEAARCYWETLKGEQKNNFRFHHVSTDEVYGTLDLIDLPFEETSLYRPNSPYSASKAASDHLVRAWHHTYGLPVLTTNCSNNYGPYHFPKKLIPYIIVSALAGKNLNVYGDGQQIRDWLYVKDHCRAIRRVLDAGRIGETYNIGGRNEKTNIEVVNNICLLLDELRPRANSCSYRCQINYVADRPGHDRRYAISSTKIENELGWLPLETFESGIKKTVQWYLENSEWITNRAMHFDSEIYRLKQSSTI